jgi:hypothetical protein
MACIQEQEAAGKVVGRIEEGQRQKKILIATKQLKEKEGSVLTRV